MSFTLVCINVYHRTNEWFNSEIQAILLNMTVSPCAVCLSSSGVFSPWCPQRWDSQPRLNAAVDLPVMAISVLAHQQPRCTAALLSDLDFPLPFPALNFLFWTTIAENMYRKQIY